VCELPSLGRREAHPARQRHLRPCCSCPTRRSVRGLTMASVKELFNLSGKTALITGGSRGLGLQIAEAFGELGVKLAITARKQGELDEAAALLSKQGVETLTIAGDLSKFETIPAMVDKAVDRYGTIDILVNNAGTTWGAPAEEHPPEAWHKVMNLNVSAMFCLTQEVGRRCR